MEFGVVTSASIIPGCSDSDAAARHAKERKVSAGLHLNLTEDYPLSPKNQITSIVDANGHFFEPNKLRMLIDEGKIQKEHLEREIRAQVEWIFDTYGSPSHIDSHHHVHVLPMVIDALLPILERYGFRFVRIPCELPLPPFGFEVPEEQLERIKQLGDEALAAKEIYVSHGIMTTDHFRGLTLAGNASLKNLRHILGKLPEGTTELMVHPGSAITYGTAFDLNPQRQTELRMLLDETIPALLKERKIEVCSWEQL